MTEFYNALDVLGKENFQQKNQSLEIILSFLKERGILEVDDKIVSLQEAIDAVKKYAESYGGANELTSILSAQTWLLETMSKAHSILKKLRREKIKSVTENITTEEIFRDLKIIYHGSEDELQSKI